MKIHARMVIETDPKIKQMANYIKYATGCSIKEIIEKLISQEFLRVKSVMVTEEIENADRG